MNFNRLKSGIIAVALMASAACADSGLEPRTAAPATVSASLIGKSVKLHKDTTVTQFTIDPKTATRFDVGSKHELFIPAKAVCDPARSSYGVTEWDKPCVLLQDRLVITAKTWIGADSLPKVEFEPSLRFTPNLQGRFVTLYMEVDSKEEAEQGLTILYCRTTASLCYDESLTDPSLATEFKKGKGQVSRRIKHFSVYNVSSGRTEAVSSEAN